jgi:hypothetical protein
MRQHFIPDDLQGAARQRVRPKGIMTYPDASLLEAVKLIAEVENRSMSNLYDLAMREYVARKAVIESE